MDVKMLAKLMSADGYIQVNREFARRRGVLEAVFLGELLSTYLYCESSGALEDGEWFYEKVADVERKYGLGKKAQSSIIASMEADGIISMRRMGTHGLRYFRINVDRVCDMMRPEAPEAGAVTDQKEPSSSPAESGHQGSFGHNLLYTNKNRGIRTEGQGRAGTRAAFAPGLEQVRSLCVKNGFRGMNDTPEQMAEWFCSVATEPDGTLNYKGRKIRDVASLVAVLRSADVSGRSFRSARRGGHTNARGEDFDASGYWKDMGYGGEE